jgi:alpha-L-rhamnosidase
MILSDKFICAGGGFSTYEIRVTAPWFKKDIVITGNITDAQITVCGLGFYELFLNNMRITKGFLSPYISNPNDVIFYDNYVITDLLKEENEFTFLLGNGMQNPFGGFVGDMEKAEFRGTKK